MALPNIDTTNLAYDLSRFDTEDREQKREKQRKEAEQQRKAIKLAPHSVSKSGSVFQILVCLSAVFALLCAFNYFDTKTDDMARVVASQQAELAEEMDTNELLQTRLDSKVNTAYIEQYATERLGMQKVTSAQKKYISINTESLIETQADNSEGFVGGVKKWFDGVLEYIGL